MLVDSFILKVYRIILWQRVQKSCCYHMNNTVSVDSWSHDFDRVVQIYSGKLIYHVVDHSGRVSLGKSKSGSLYPKTDFAFLYLNPKMV